MNWTALHTSPLWREFWASAEVNNLREAARRTLIHANLTPEARGVVRGRLMLLEELEKTVAQLADKQMKVADNERKDVLQRLADEFVAELPRVF